MEPHIFCRKETETSKVAEKSSNQCECPVALKQRTLMAESEEELKSLLMKVKEEGEEADLKLNIQKTKIMASCP